MYLVADVGGTKTLIALMTNKGQIRQKIKFPTPKKYKEFVDEFTTATKPIIKKVDMISMAIPGRIDHEHGVGEVFGNLPWKNVPIDRDIEKATGVSTIIENDSKVGGLAEAVCVQHKYKKVLYVAIGTGIGVAVINDGRIPEAVDDIEAGFMQFTRDGKQVAWEDFASGDAIKKRYGKEARQLKKDDKKWNVIAKDIGVGLMELIPVFQPDAIIIGGGIGAHFSNYGQQLKSFLKKHETHMAPIPPILKARQPEEAVLLGNYYLIQQHNEKANS